MLILSRRNGESIRIGDEVIITVLQCKGGQVKIGINAPRDVAVHREEVYERLQQDLTQNCATKTPAQPDSGDQRHAELA